MYRKISKYIEEYLTSDESKILCIDGARQIGKTYIIRELASKHFKNYIEINMADDKTGDKLFANVKTIDSFYLELSVIEVTNSILERIQLYSLMRFKNILNY